MKTEELLRRQAAEKSTRVNHWPWLVPDSNPGVEIVTLFEGWIREDGAVVPCNHARQKKKIHEWNPE